MRGAAAAVFTIAIAVLASPSLAASRNDEFIEQIALGVGALILSCGVMLCIATLWTGGCTRLCRRFCGDRVNEDERQAYRFRNSEYGAVEKYDNASEEVMRMPLRVGIFVDGKPMENAPEWSSMDWEASVDEETGVHSVAIGLHSADHTPITLQTNRPLCQATPELDLDCYYEVKIVSLQGDARIGIGWSTPTHPPMMMVGDTEMAHAIAVHSCRIRAIVDTHGPVSRPKVGSKGYLVMKHSEDKSGGQSMETRSLKEGDVLGVGYRQFLSRDASLKDEKLNMRFNWWLNGVRVDLPLLDTTWPAYNEALHRPDTHQGEILQKIMEKPDLARIGILANGCCYPTISASGPAIVEIRFDEPFEQLNRRLTTYQNRAVSKVAAKTQADEILEKVRYEQKQKELADHDSKRRLAQKQSVGRMKQVEGALKELDAAMHAAFDPASDAAASKYFVPGSVPDTAKGGAGGPKFAQSERLPGGRGRRGSAAKTLGAQSTSFHSERRRSKTDRRGSYVDAAARAGAAKGLYFAQEAERRRRSLADSQKPANWREGLSSGKW